MASADSNVQTGAGTTISISAATPATFDEAGYAALSFTEISEVTNGGGHGAEYALVTHSALGRRNVIKRKGSLNYGSKQLELGQDLTDAGQALLDAAANLDADQSFKIEYQDGSIDYLCGLVMSFVTNIGGNDDIISASVGMEVNGAVVRVAAP